MSHLKLLNVLAILLTLLNTNYGHHTIWPHDTCCECLVDTGVPGCSADALCETIICGADALCCDPGWWWDSICVGDAGFICHPDPETPSPIPWAPDTPAPVPWTPDTPSPIPWAPNTPSPIQWAPNTPSPVQWSPPGEWCPNSQRVCDRAGECCSQWGWCGTTATHCAEHGEWCHNSNRFCTVDECCSDNGWCGTGDAYCGMPEPHPWDTPAPIHWTPDTPSPVTWTPETPAPIHWTPDTPSPIPWTPDTPAPIHWTPETPAPIPWGPNTPEPTPWMHCDSVANCDCVPQNNGQPGHGCNGKCDGWYRACPDWYNGVWTSNYDHFVMCANGDYFLRPCANEGWNPWTHQFDRLTWNDYDKTCDWSTSDRPNCDPYQEPGP